MTILQSIGQAVVGTTVQTRFSISIPSNTLIESTRAFWQLLDLGGYVWANGDCTNIVHSISQTNPNELMLSGDSTIPLPSNLIANNLGSRYQIRYTVIFPESPPLFVFDQFTLLPPTETAYGALDQVEMYSKNSIYLTLILPEQAKDVNCIIQARNITVTVAESISDPVATQTGYKYKAKIPAPTADPQVLTTLEPYTVIWTYTDAQEVKQTEIGRLFIVNSSILDVSREVQLFINRAYTDGGISPGTTFHTVDVLEYLRVGRDQFNAAVMPTNITMVNATSQYRWFWVMYSSAAACRAQYLAEGMKAFDYGGQEVTLNIDRTQYWDSIAQNLEQQANDQIKPFKTILYKRGAVNGDGSSVALQANAVGSIGISIHAASPLRAGFFGGFGPIGFIPYMGW